MTIGNMTDYDYGLPYYFVVGGIVATLFSGAVGVLYLILLIFS